VIKNCWFLEIMPMLGGLLITVLPELNSSAAPTPIAQHIVVIFDSDVGCGSETGSGGEEREDADPDPDAKCSGGVGAVDGMRIGDDGVMVVVVVVMVEGGSGGDDEEVAEAYHAHIGGGSEAVVDRPGGRGGPHSGGGSGAGSGGGWSGIEAEGELIRRGSARAG
jgi:hypothetical protein